MIEARLLFGDGTVDVQLPDHAQVVGGGDGTASGPRLEPAADQEAAVREALSRPLGLPRVGETVEPGDSVLIAFDDPTVPSFGPVRRLAIEAILEELAAAGVAEENVNLVCANALHRKWTDAELTSILGPDLVRRFGDRLTCHDAEDAGNLTYLGTTPSGYDVEIHRLAAESDLTVYVNAAVHLGFSGGWKSVCVGLSTWRSIRWTHTPDGMSMSVRENRMHTVLDEMGAVVAANLKRPVFKVETVLANPATIGRVWAGGVAECRAAAVEMQASLHKPRRSEAEPADVVIYGVPAWSPYATFARMNPLLTLVSSGLGYLGGYIEALGKPGCSVIMATPCPNDWDLEHHPAHADVWERVLPQSRDPYEISARFGEEYANHPAFIERYRFGVAYHPIHAILATHPLKRLRHAGRVFVAGAQDPAVPRHVGFTPTATVEEALAEAERIHGRDCSIVCIRHFAGW
ncbi:MAG: lactate racemase domain-containing protein [Dehalococcoidia bacterium]|nr:lactate racemase domain-containing protein [Dehalococcoidia bacterium]